MKMKWKSSHNAAVNAKAALPKLVERYFEAGRETVDGKQSPKELHRFRIATKRFRYSLEIFRPVYGPGLERQLGTLRGLQKVLGKLSDYHAIRKTVEGDGALEARLERAAKKTLKEFHECWKTFDSPGQLRRWKTYLAHGGSRRPARARSK